MGLLEQALALHLRRPQDYFGRVWSTAFSAAELTNLVDASLDPPVSLTESRTP